MKRKITAFCTATVMICSFFAVAGSKNSCDSVNKDVSTAVIEQKYNGAETRDEAADMNESDTAATTASTATTSSGLNLDDLSGLLGDSAGSILDGGLGDLGGLGSVGEIFGDAGDVIGSVLGNNSSNGNSNSNTQNTVPATQNYGYNSIYLDPVPAATYVQSQKTTETETENTTQAVDESVDASAGEAVLGTTSNPYKKPSEDIKLGDSGDGVKWVQWVLQFTDYGLQGKAIDGIYDEATEAVVKKFQKEQGLTDDGIINSATVDKLEIMYYRYAMTFTTAATEVSTTIPQITDESDENNKGLSTAVIIAIIAAVWCLAIAVIVVLIIMKKKKDKASEDSGNKSDSKVDGDMNLTDLFEEANKK